jgi:hypothetical protein
MRKELIIGIGAIATAGAIGGMIMLAGSGGRDVIGPMDEQGSETSDADRAKIEELAWEERHNEDKYSFCLGEATMSTFHEDSLLGQQGTVSHHSRELLLFDKEAQKFFVLTRTIDFSYEGKLNTVMGDLVVDVPVSETGSLSEAYTKKEMPIRIDYANNYIVTDPTTKKTTWVRSSLDEDELVMPYAGCAGTYQLDNTMGKDMLVGGEFVQVDKVCDEKGVAGSFNGDFTFSCSVIPYQEAKRMYDVVAVKESPTDKGEFCEEQTVEDAIGGADADTRPEDIQKNLDQLKDEMGGSQRAE